MANDWASGRPVFTSLPETGYQDNEVVDWLTSWVDEKLTAKAIQLQGFWQYLNPDGCPDIYLDYLAYLVGLSGKYWDSKWQPSVKREMIRFSHSLWSNRGTLFSIKKVLDIQGLNYKIWTRSALNLPFTLPGIFGSNNLTMYVRLPISYQRGSTSFKEVERTIRNYAPSITKVRAVYEKFYLGYSLLGDPLFTK